MHIEQTKSTLVGGGHDQRRTVNREHWMEQCGDKTIVRDLCQHDVRANIADTRDRRSDKSRSEAESHGGQNETAIVGETSGRDTLLVVKCGEQVAGTDVVDGHMPRGITTGEPTAIDTELGARNFCGEILLPT